MPATSFTASPDIEAAVLKLLDELNEQSQERRWEPRVIYVQPVWVLLPPEDSETAEQTGHAIRATTTDLSTSGIGLLVPRLIPSRQIGVEIRRMWFRCEVVWSETVGYCVYRYGTRILEVVERNPGDPDVRLQALLA